MVKIHNILKFTVKKQRDVIKFRVNKVKCLKFSVEKYNISTFKYNLFISSVKKKNTEFKNGVFYSEFKTVCFLAVGVKKKKSRFT